PHKASCSAGGSLTRHSHYARVRLGGLTIWRVQCTACKAVIVLDGGFIRRTPIDRDLLRDAVAADRLLEKAEGGLLIALLGQEKINGLALLIHGTIEVAPLPFDLDGGLVHPPTDPYGTLTAV